MGLIKKRPMQAPEYWFPMEAMVLENVLPYDPEEAIDVFVVTRRERLSVDGIGMGDLLHGGRPLAVPCPVSVGTIRLRGVGDHAASMVSQAIQPTREISTNDVRQRQQRVSHPYTFQLGANIYTIMPN